MAAEALIRSLRPPDRYPPRLGTLSAEQEAVVISFLEMLALTDSFNHLRDGARQALEEWCRRAYGIPPHPSRILHEQWGKTHPGGIPYG